MRKERVFIVFILMIIVVGMVFLGLYVVAQKNLETSRDQLKAEVVEIEQRYQQYVNSKTRPEGETVPDLPVSDEGANETIEDTVTALEQMDEKIISLESDERKHDKFDAIYFTEKYWDDLPDNKKQLAKDFFEDNQNLVLEIRQLAATGGPFGKLDFSQGSSIEVPHLPRIMNCRMLLESHAFLAALSGDYEEAAKDYIAIMQFADGIGKEPVFISQLRKTSDFRDAFEGVVEHVPGEMLSPDTVMQIIKQASQMIHRDVYAESQRRYALHSDELFEDIKSGDFDYERFSSISLHNGLDSFLFRFQGNIIMRPFLVMDEQSYTDTMERLGEISQYPYYEAKPMLGQITNEIENLPRTSLFSREHLPLAIELYSYRQTLFEAEAGLLQVGFAIELHHGQHGVYPRTLDEIAPTLGGKIPLDPYTGEYFVYELEEDSFLLYSARGSIIDDPSGRGFVPYTDRNGNLVWRGPQDWRESNNR